MRWWSLGVAALVVLLSIAVVGLVGREAVELRCPECGSADVIPIVCGKPGRELMAQEAHGQAT